MEGLHLGKTVLLTSPCLVRRGGEREGGRDSGRVGGGWKRGWSGVVEEGNRARQVGENELNTQRKSVQDKSTLSGGHEWCVDCYEVHNGPQLLQLHELYAKLASEGSWNEWVIPDRL